MMRTDLVLAALGAFVLQRPGMEPGNYGWGAEGARAYRAELRRVTRDRHDAERLLSHFGVRAVPLETLRGAFRAYSGRLTLHEHWEQHSAETYPGKPCGSECDHREFKGCSVSYCTGQYFATEYRRAVCAMLAQALWDHWREGYAASAKRGESAGDAIRRNFRREFGAHFARRWFDA